MENQKNVPTNDEIIDELTKDLESHCIPAEVESSVPIPEENEKESVFPEDFEKSDSEDEVHEDSPNDLIDEEGLKEIELKLSVEELEERYKESLELKGKGNDLFKQENYLESIENYTSALRICPLKYPKDRAIFYSNRAASKIKVERTKSAIDDCSKSIELAPDYLKAYLRRAKVYESTEKLDESLADWKKILELDAGNHEARAACMRLPPMINERNEKLKTEMLGKLKSLGNVFLKPFGLSTENFNLQQDPNTGSYSVNFQQQKK
ncbi:PREDICTED: tetratricopeptide repeat protein 1 [Nicrophorus vespilloides]|uniref:Tetratricopeptide repeat protein 1 n=1 Tax=Nicrophorus vespilloides TaxID=110193 RepID=A0ABM1M663_NICVS|nr:PREDICTED: tetratricopeptide repeat protein 1 [Nicrophorus vespilloides]